MSNIHDEIRDTSGNELVTLTYDRIIDCLETDLSYRFVFGDQLVPLSKRFVEDIRDTCKEVDIPRWLMIKAGLEGYAV